MIQGQFHAGSGLGDQLFRLVTVHTLAKEKGYAYGMKGEFKGDFFINQPIITDHTSTASFNEEDTRENGNDIRSYDPEINFVQDNTIVDGSFEDSKYWGHNLKNIDQWLAVTPLNVPDNRCIIGFRGGEYATIPELFLPKSYYQKAIKKMLDLDPDMEFEVHTDDPILAMTYFPDYPIIDNRPISHSKHENMGYNWRAARYAKYAIIPNSAFFILPRILKHFNSQAVTIAPRFWAGHNSRIWKRPACFYPQFSYIHASDSD